MPASCTTLAARPQSDAETEATAATTAIAGLRRRLSHQGVIEHPAVRRELRKLEEQLAAQFDGTARAPGRHRSPAGAPGADRDRADHDRADRDRADHDHADHDRASRDIGSSREPGHEIPAHRARQAKRAAALTETS